MVSDVPSSEGPSWLQSTQVGSKFLYAIKNVLFPVVSDIAWGFRAFLRELDSGPYFGPEVRGE